MTAALSAAPPSQPGQIFFLDSVNSLAIVRTHISKARSSKQKNVYESMFTIHRRRGSHTDLPTRCRESSG